MDRLRDNISGGMVPNHFYRSILPSLIRTSRQLTYFDRECGPRRPAAQYGVAGLPGIHSGGSLQCHPSFWNWDLRIP